MERTTLKRLNDVSERQEDAVAAELADAVREIEVANERLAALQRYVDEYATLMEQGMERGMSAVDSRNYQQFMLNLGRSVAVQKRTLAAHREQFSVLQGRWHEARRRRQSYKVLLVRAEMRIRRTDLRRLQRELDELSRPCVGGVWPEPGRSV